MWLGRFVILACLWGYAAEVFKRLAAVKGRLLPGILLRFKKCVWVGFTEYNDVVFMLYWSFLYELKGMGNIQCVYPTATCSQILLVIC